ncbi:hypothetical protein OG887_42810 (plasmid) [Streptomyces sp. NBC_00053]|uniref:hypothetical protein n=1 Tax=unclassified Streptomyces TaxID=2593676 RepID=UPI0022567365|nr:MULTISPECIES: hypothetical protein [unclassified Streptomyces]MCX5505942.1 hypothetical protein [Streptomyces sp. NBC_00052]MCX5553593.1 hypothetical protein [Streptomyces sp. NBC_00051]
MWAALITLSGYVPLPLTGADYLELLPVRWQPITDRGIRLNYRTYNHDILTPVIFFAVLQWGRWPPGPV